MEEKARMDMSAETTQGGAVGYDPAFAERMFGSNKSYSVNLKEDEGPDHQELQKSVQRQIASYRVPMLIDPIWTIEAQIVCPSEMKDDQALIWWDAGRFYACLKMRCDTPNILILWLVIHELFELLDGETADIFADAITNGDLPIECKNLLIAQYDTARNKTIERNVTRYLGYSRPLTSTEDFFKSTT
jgi:hypothetical protein